MIKMDVVGSSFDMTNKIGFMLLDKVENTGRGLSGRDSPTILANNSKSYHKKQSKEKESKGKENSLRRGKKQGKELGARASLIDSSFLLGYYPFVYSFSYVRLTMSFLFKLVKSHQVINFIIVGHLIIFFLGEIITSTIVSHGLSNQGSSNTINGLLVKRTRRIHRKWGWFGREVQTTRGDEVDEIEISEGIKFLGTTEGIKDSRG